MRIRLLIRRLPRHPLVPTTAPFEVRFTLTGGAVFDANVAGLIYDQDADGDESPVAAPGTVASIMEGGRKGENYVTIKIEEAGETPTTHRRNTAPVDREPSGAIPASVLDHTIGIQIAEAGEPWPSGRCRLDRCGRQ